MKSQLRVIGCLWYIFAAVIALPADGSKQTFYTHSGTSVILSPELITRISKSLHARIDSLVFYDMDNAYPWLKNGKIFIVRNWDRHEDLQIFIGTKTQNIIKDPESLSDVFSSNETLPKPLEIADLIAWAVIQSPSMVVQPLFLNGPCWENAKIADRDGLEKELKKKLEFTINTDQSWRLEFNVIKSDGGCEHVSVSGELSPIVVTELHRTILEKPGCFPWMAKG
jgi:hypothetical protein